eukprot:scaffold2532_cov79-Skeletonema_menzelii.AAC.38
MTKYFHGENKLDHCLENHDQERRNCLGHEDTRVTTATTTQTQQKGKFPSRRVVSQPRQHPLPLPLRLQQENIKRWPV